VHDAIDAMLVVGAGRLIHDGVHGNGEARIPLTGSVVELDVIRALLPKWATNGRGRRGPTHPKCLHGVLPFHVDHASALQHNPWVQSADPPSATRAALDAVGRTRALHSAARVHGVAKEAVTWVEVAHHRCHHWPRVEARPDVDITQVQALQRDRHLEDGHSFTVLSMTS
jgi:hypothetical protein